MNEIGDLAELGHVMDAGASVCSKLKTVRARGSLTRLGWNDFKIIGERTSPVESYQSVGFCAPRECCVFQKASA
jgi:hypothetical protein